MIDEMVAAGKSEQDSVTLSAVIASDFQRDDCARCHRIIYHIDIIELLLISYMIGDVYWGR